MTSIHARLILPTALKMPSVPAVTVRETLRTDMIVFNVLGNLFDYPTPPGAVRTSCQSSLHGMPLLVHKDFRFCVRCITAEVAFVLRIRDVISQNMALDSAKRGELYFTSFTFETPAQHAAHQLVILVIKIIERDVLAISTLMDNEMMCPPHMCLQ